MAEEDMNGLATENDYIRIGDRMNEFCFEETLQTTIFCYVVINKVDTIMVLQRLCS